MPAYNVAPFVREAVLSILNQSFKDFELIIIDDGSKDSTLQVLQQLATEDDRIRLISQPNAGVSAASNHAISLAKSEFVARVDADDVVQPRRMELQLQYMKAHPQCVAVGSAMLLIDETGLPLYPMSHIEFGHQNIDASLMNGGWPIAQPSCMYRRQAVLAAGGYLTSLSLHEDHDLFLKLAEIGELENLPEILQHYRQRSTSLMAQESESSHSRVMPEILLEARRRRGLPQTLPVKAIKPLVPPLEKFRRWAWRSLKAGHVQTARKYARASLRKAPFSANSWKLMYCARCGDIECGLPLPVPRERAGVRVISNVKRFTFEIKVTKTSPDTPGEGSGLAKIDHHRWCTNGLIMRSYINRAFAIVLSESAANSAAFTFSSS